MPRSHLQESLPRAWLQMGAIVLACLPPVTLWASERTAWRSKMQPVIPLGYVARHTAAPPVIDGKLYDSAWTAVPWTDDFVDIEGAAKPAPRFRTRAKMMWDHQYLYIAAEMEEPHVWGTLTAHDSVIFRDPDFEVFIDPDGDTHRYAEFEINALNTGWDLELVKPYMDGGPARNEWEIPGLKTAIHVRGTLNRATDTDKGWTVELALPWLAFADRARHAGPPQEGEQWRLNFSRVEWRITTDGDAYQKVPDTPEDNWVWSPQGVIDMHRPEMWGLLQFTRRPGKEVVTVTPIPGKPARDALLEIYYAQLDFFKAHERWAKSLVELGWEPPALPAGVATPDFRVTSDGYECRAVFEDQGRQRSWTIRQDRLLRLD